MRRFRSAPRVSGLVIVLVLCAAALSPVTVMAKGRGKAKVKKRSGEDSSWSQPVTVKAGVGIADATWHVGAGSGQYADKDVDVANAATGGEVDPSAHAHTQRKSYGVQSRLTYRTIVVEGNNGERLALVKSDSYLAQDMLARRAAQLLASGHAGTGIEGDSGIEYGDIMLMASHNHSSPYYTTPSWGVWLFQDVFDLRAFEYHARAMALSIERATQSLVPARMGATTVEHTIYKGNIVGAGTADDGTPRGYPDSHGDMGLSVMRFDDLSDPDNPKPLAVLANFGQHPESLDGYDLITADFLAPLERFVNRELGATLVFGQGDVGSAEGPYFRGDNAVLPDGVIQAWAHVGHAQTERGARYLADSIREAWDEIGAGGGQVPFSSDFAVEAGNAWIPGPVSHPYPSVSNCRTETTAEGGPGSPIIGLPDCERGPFAADQQSMVWENLKEHGLPVPEHYDAPAFKAVEENMRLHLQAFKVGDVILASCSCEAQNDLILNLESRLDRVQGNIWRGYDWGEHCAQNADTTWTCPTGRNMEGTTTVSDERYLRMRAQVNNDAAGWDAPENAVAANGEPADPTQIWGNFTHEELSEELGYGLAIGVGHATDYLGYTVSYREYMGYDHYRKALTSYGPHTADYMNTRLVRLGGELNGGPALAPEPHDAFAQADEARQVAEATALGQAAEKAYDAWIAALPDDAGPAEALEQPTDITRFAATTLTWRGGSNAVDNPIARVQRLVDGEWVDFADHSGEVQTKVTFPNGYQGIADTYAGNTEWKWTANFEAFDAFPARLGQTPTGTYRFVVDGLIRQDGSDVAYTIESESFSVSPWEGITIESIEALADGDVAVDVAPITYPRTYESPFRYVADDGNATLCKTCSFRPWASTGEAAHVFVTVHRASGITELVEATLQEGRWIASAALQSGDAAFVERGGVVDTFGEVNGTASASVTR